MSTIISSSSSPSFASPWRPVLLLLLLLASNSNVADGFSVAASIQKPLTTTVPQQPWMIPPPPPQLSPPPVKLSWETSACDYIRKLYEESRTNSVGDSNDSASPFMCAVVGIPGSGKTTSASILADMLNKDFGDSSSSGGDGGGCFLMPFDGYHIPMKDLLTFPNAKDAIYRRGAPDTFDAAALMKSLEAIRYGNEPTLAIPGFDHAKGDPEEGAHLFDRRKHKIVIVEGLYLLHDQDGWERVADYFDFSIYVHADIDVCMERLKFRNRVIPGYTPEEIDIRVDAVDRANALVVQKSMHRAKQIVQSAAY